MNWKPFMEPLGSAEHNLGTAVIKYWLGLLTIHLYVQQMNFRTSEEDIVKHMFGEYIYAIYCSAFSILVFEDLISLPTNYMIISVIYYKAQEAPT
jgi:hypothetical protein